MYRKKRGFSEREVAQLLGVAYWSTVSRYENGVRRPGLTAILILEIVYGEDARKLFEGIYESVVPVIRERAQQLLREIETQPRTLAIKRKKESLADIISREDKNNAA